MKKYLLILGVISVCALSANAAVVKYTPAGAIKDNTQNTFGSNAAFTPANRVQAGVNQRYIENEKLYYKQFENANKIEVNINTNNSSNDNSNNNKQEVTEKTTSSQTAKTDTKKNINYIKSWQFWKKDNGLKTINGVTYY